MAAEAMYPDKSEIPVFEKCLKCDALTKENLSGNPCVIEYRCRITRRAVGRRFLKAAIMQTDEKICPQSPAFVPPDNAAGEHPWPEVRDNIIDTEERLHTIPDKSRKH